MDQGLSADEIWRCLAEDEDAGDSVVSRTAPRKSHSEEVYQGRRPSSQKGSLFVEEVAELYAGLRTLPSTLERDVASCCVLVASAFGIPCDQLKDACQPLGSDRWANPLDPQSAPTAPGLLLCKPPEVGSWQGAMVLSIGERLPRAPKDVEAAWLYDVAPLISLPLAAPLAALLATLLQSHPDSHLDSTDGQLRRLHWPQGLIRPDALENLLPEIRRAAPRVPCSPERISNALHSGLRARRVDPAIRGLLQADPGRDPAIATYYTAVRVERVCDAVLAFQNELCKQIGLADAPVSILAPAGARRVGSRRVPKRSTTSRAIVAMTQWVGEEMARPRLGLRDVVRRHNVLVNHLAFQFYVTCGLRPSKNALPTSILHGWPRDRFSVADKGVPSRQLPLTSNIQAAMQALERDMSQTADISAVLCSHSLERALGFLPGSESDLFRILELGLDRGVRARAWEPDDLDKCLVEVGIPVPIRHWRHALRTDLVDLGTDPSDIEAVLGHFQIGKEPWASTSYKIAVDFLPHLRQILEQRLAWVAQ